MSGRKIATRTFWLLGSGLLVLGAAMVITPLRGQTEPQRTGAFPAPSEQLPAPIPILPAPGANTHTAARQSQGPIAISADFSQEWETRDYYIALLRGRCRLVQDDMVLTSEKMAVWRAKGIATGAPEELQVYLEDNVKVDRPGETTTHTSLVMPLTSSAGVTIGVQRRLTDQPGEEDALYQRASQHLRTAQRQPTPAAAPPLAVPAPDGPQFPSMPIQAPLGNVRRIRIFPRSSVPYNVVSFESRQTTPPEQIIVLTGGVNLLVDGLQAQMLQEYGMQNLGTVDLSADRVVIWTQAMEGTELSPETFQPSDAPLQVYLEGDIVLRQGNNTVRATHAFYDLKEERALLLNAELRTFVPSLGGNFRVRAERIRQLNRNTFQAQNAWMTTSQFGEPGYRLQSSEIFLEQRPVAPWIGAGGPLVDPTLGGEPAPTVPYVTALNNTFFLENIPLVSVPQISGPAEDPNIPLRRISLANDQVFGFQLETVWDMAQIVGADLAPGNNWELYLNEYTERGPAIGTGGQYQGVNLFGLGGTYSGEALFMYQHDDGEDNLGLDRRNLPLEDDERGRALLRHRQEFSPYTSLIAELGFLSDRNYLEQYYEREFDSGKDNETLLYFKHLEENYAATVLGRVRVNDFENQTDWLPKGDLYVLSEPLFGGAMTWSSHSSIGYGHLQPAEPPFNPMMDIFTPLPYVADSQGLVSMTRHEIDAPFNLGPLKIVPYAMGEGAFWEEGFTQDSVDRLAGQLGIRSSIMFWRVYPYIQSRTLNLNGLAHKINLEADYSFTETTEDYTNIPQYNEFDDNAQERFRERLVLNTFGGALPPEADPRFYAIRTGAGWQVTAPYHELIDDQQVARLRLRQRLQTRVGPPDRQRIKDWMLLDLEASYFPEADRDNFGEELGLLGANYRWNVGDRTSLLAGALFDVFDDGQEIWNVGILSQRSTRGSAFVGFRQISIADLESQILTASYSYAMSPKWVSTMGTAYDLAEGQNRGQSLTITRIGADFLVHLGVKYDSSKDNFGVGLSVEPKFGPFSGSSNLSTLLDGH